ncbi:conserved hypothetical protein [Candidatus Terasakiella magnetica]|nr:conserved hypothetical protein [Candidatus Terasakiella magnetica]
MRRNRSNPFGRLLAVTATILLISAVAFMTLEYISGLALKLIRDKRSAVAAAYSDDDIKALYDTDQPSRYRTVLSESWRAGETTYTPFVEYRMTPGKSKTFTIAEEGYRGNGGEGQDLIAKGAKVFVFGGSTTLGFGVADDETIPAMLEKMLHAAGRSDLQVFNFGATAYTSTSERITLETLLTSGIKPDVAVFIDGLGDFDYCAAPDQSAWNDRLVQLTRGRARLPLAVELFHRSNVVQIVRHLGGDRSVSLRDWGAFCRNDEDVDRAVRRLDTNHRMIDAMAERLGFKAVFVQQPVPTYGYDNRKRPLPVKDEMLGYHVNSAKGYLKLAELRAEGKLWERGLLWLADLEPAEGNAYIDAVHYSPGFNRVIAEKIAAALQDGGMLPPP